MMVIPEDQWNEIANIKKWRKKSKRVDYKTNKHVYNFQQYESIRYFAKTVFAGNITLDDADNDQSDLWNEFVDFKTGTRP